MDMNPHLSDRPPKGLLKITPISENLNHLATVKVDSSFNRLDSSEKTTMHSRLGMGRAGKEREGKGRKVRKGRL